MTKIILVVFLLLIMSCSTSPINNNEELMRFANSNCIFWYFKSKNLDIDEIKKITSGIVEKSHISAEKFQQVAMLVKEFKPSIKTKSNVDVQLAKCFLLADDITFSAELERIRNL